MSRENAYWEVGDKVITKDYKEWAWDAGTIGVINKIHSDYEGKKLPESAYQVFYISLFQMDGVTPKPFGGTYWTTPDEVYRYDGTPNEVFWPIEDIENEGKRRFKLPDDTAIYWDWNGVKFTF